MVPKRSTDGYYHGYVKDVTKKSGRRQVKAKTLEELSQKMERKEPIYPSFEYCYQKTQSEQLKYVKDNDKKLSVANTIQRHHSDYKRYFSGTKFEKLPINKITSKDVKEHCIYTLESNDLRRKAFNNYLGILKSTFIFALDEELIEENPLITINFASPKFVNMLAADSDIGERIYSDKELELMLDWLHDRQALYPDRICYMALEYQILLGERRGEVAPSKWEDIQEEDGVRFVEIRRELIENKEGTGDRIVEHTKTYKNRRVPVFDELEEFLIRLLHFHEINHLHSEFLFPSKRSLYGCIHVKTTYKVHYEMCKELGIEINKSMPKGTHAYRRNFAKRVGNAELASKLLGNDEKVLRKNYYDGVNLSVALSVLNGKQIR